MENSTARMKLENADTGKKIDENIKYSHFFNLQHLYSSVFNGWILNLGNCLNGPTEKE